MNQEPEIEWDKEIRESIITSLKRLNEKIRNREERLRNNPDFVELEQARRQYNLRNPRNLNSMGYAMGYIYHFKKLKQAKVRKFAREHKPISLFHDEWQSNARIDYERCSIDLVEYQKLNGEKSGVYGAIHETHIGSWMRTLDLFRFKNDYGLETLKKLAQKAKDEKHMMTISEECKIVDYIGQYYWDNRGTGDKKIDELWAKLLPEEIR